MSVRDTLVWQHAYSSNYGSIHKARRFCACKRTILQTKKKKKNSVRDSRHASAKWWGWWGGLVVWQKTCELCSTDWVWHINDVSIFCIPTMLFLVGRSLECHCYKNLKYLTTKKVWITTTISMGFLWAMDASTGVQSTRWFKYDRDWFVCKQAALHSSCATLREWSGRDVFSNEEFDHNALFHAPRYLLFAHHSSNSQTGLNRF